MTTGRRCWRVAAAAAMLAGLAHTACQAADDAAQFEKGKQLFMQGTTPSCAVCHTLRHAGSKGAVGPVLDELQPDAPRVATALRNGIGAMPSFRAALTEDQIAALAFYVSKASQTAP